MAAIEAEYGSPLADCVVSALAGFIIHLRYGFLITPTPLPRMRKSPFVTTMGSWISLGLSVTVYDSSDGTTSKAVGEHFCFATDSNLRFPLLRALLGVIDRHSSRKPR